VGAAFALVSSQDHQLGQRRGLLQRQVGEQRLATPDLRQIAEGLFNAQRHDEGDTGGLRVGYRQAQQDCLLLARDPFQGMSFEQRLGGRLDGAGLGLTDPREKERQGEREKVRST
jgi:hypothetical protein